MQENFQEKYIQEKGSIEVSYSGVFSIQERPFWGEFKGAEIDGTGKYTEPTIEQKEKFEKRAERVSEVFESADFQWYLDGAVNISLYGDKLIRDHKDLDIGIFQGDLAKLEELLLRQGFGIFVNFQDNGKSLMRRTTAKELVTLGEQNLSICRVNSDGKIQREADDLFNFVDLHVNSKNTEGDTVISYNNASLPKKFYKPIRKKLSNDKEINLSQPVVVAYHKLHSSRPYDLTDLQRLRPYLRGEDFVILRKSLEREIGETEKMVKEELQEAWLSLAPILELTSDQGVIGEKLWEHPEFQKRRSEQKISEFVSSISQYISNNPGMTFGDFLSQSLVILKIREQIEQKLEFIDKLEKDGKEL